MTSVCYIRVYIFKEFVHVSIGISTLTDRISGGADKVGPLATLKKIYCQCNHIVNIPLRDSHGMHKLTL